MGSQILPAAIQQAPSFNLEDPEVKLVDLDGDGVTDAIRSGSRLEVFLQRSRSEGWGETRWVERQALDDFPNVNFSDPRVRLARHDRRRACRTSS